MSGTTDKYMGKGKQMAGKATDNKKMQAKGKVQEGKGRLKGVAGDVTNDY